MNTLDVRALLQDDAIQHVDMEEDPPEEDKKSDNEVVELDNEVSKDAVWDKKARSHKVFFAPTDPDSGFRGG